MKLEFNRATKIKSVGTRLTQEEYEIVSQVANVHGCSLGEAIATMVRAVIKEMNLTKNNSGVICK